MHYLRNHCISQDLVRKRKLGTPEGIEYRALFAKVLLGWKSKKGKSVSAGTANWKKGIKSRERKLLLEVLSLAVLNLSER